jgi:hypothetical protein
MFEKPSEASLARILECPSIRLTFHRNSSEGLQITVELTPLPLFILRAREIFSTLDNASFSFRTDRITTHIDETTPPFFPFRSAHRIH